ncbi:MAG: hypothetical protein WA943_10495 [Parvibaculum sp.]|uniref:hypothetical protein n=1 Tax=Parvibaculum sp. TaxID=2024848 RepID=UPI003C7294D7
MHRFHDCFAAFKFFVGGYLLVFERDNSNEENEVGHRLVCCLGLFLLTCATNALACSVDPSAQRRPEDLFSDAATVVVAHLTKVEEIDAPNENNRMGVIQGTFRPIEVIKGKLPAGNKVKSPAFGPGNCSIPLLAGMDYVFYLDGKLNYVTWVTGSELLDELDSPSARQVLEKLHKLKK